jgi:hypothetical protein
MDPQGRTGDQVSSEATEEQIIDSAEGGLTRCRVIGPQIAHHLAQVEI